MITETEKGCITISQFHRTHHVTLNAKGIPSGQFHITRSAILDSSTVDAFPCIQAYIR